MRGISRAGFHVPHFAYQGTLPRTRLIRSVTENGGAERTRASEKDLCIQEARTGELLRRVYSAEHAKRTAVHKCVPRRTENSECTTPHDRTRVQALDSNSQNKPPCTVYLYANCFRPNKAELEFS